MKENYAEILKKIDLFQSIDDKVLEEIGASLSIVELEEKDILFHQGDAPDAMYIILSGYLIALLRKQNGKYRPIGRIKTGEIVGETGLLTQQPRGLTVKALSQAKLLKLSEENFNHLKKLAPDAVYQILVNTLIRNQKNISIISSMADRMVLQKCRHVVILPAHPHTKTENFIQKLYALYNKNITHLMPLENLFNIYETQGASGTLEYLDALEKTYHTIIYFATEAIEKLIPILARKIDVLAIVGDMHEPPTLSSTLQKIAAQKEMHAVKKELILLSDHRTEIQHTNAWLSLLPFHLHYHVIATEEESYKRLLRFLQGNPVGLVLSGGATKGWAHLGAIKAIKERNIPIDMVGGTSVGAGISGFYVISKDEEALQHCMQKVIDGLEKSLSWKSLTVPIISFYDSHTVTESLQEVFGDRYIEDLPIPFFSVSSNISTNTEIVHRTGKMWSMIRASGSLPALFPPVVQEGELLFDGGLINNFPVDVMRKLLGKHAIIIGSHLEITDVDKTKYDFPPILSLSQNLRSKFGGNKENFIFPPFFSTVLKAMLMGASQRSRENTLLANYYINPNLSSRDAFVFDKKEAERLFKKGYEEGLQVLKNFDVTEFK